MSALLTLEPMDGMPGMRAVVRCPHASAHQFVPADLFGSSRFDVVQFATRILEERLHEATGCDCRVPREGEMAIGVFG